MRVVSATPCRLTHYELERDHAVVYVEGERGWRSSAPMSSRRPSAACRRNDPELASYLRIEERELQAGRWN
jgi:hypothetical protein